MSTIRFAGLSDIGRVRTANEDRWFADPAEGLYLVADGIGGSAAGGLAAQIVAEVLPRLLRTKFRKRASVASPRSPRDEPQPKRAGSPVGRASNGPARHPPAPGAPGVANPADTETAQHVSAALAELSAQLRKESQATPGLAGIGATVILTLVQARHAIVSHLGDSRAYLLHAGRLQQLTKDHTIAQLLADRGQIQPDELVDHPSRSQLTRYIGMSTEAIPDTACIDLGPGDRLLLCTDGLSGLLSDRQLLTILNEHAAPDEACRHLIDAANAAGGTDNVTAVVIDIGNGAAE